MFTRGKTKDSATANVLDNIKSEPKIKRAKLIYKIMQVLTCIVIAVPVVYTLLQILVFKKDIIIALNYMLVYDVIASVVAVVIAIVGTAFNYYADILIDRRLNEMAAKYGVADKHPTGKEVKLWKVLTQVLSFLMVVFVIGMYIMLSVNQTVAIVFSAFLMACAFGVRFTLNKSNKLQDDRIANIIYAKADRESQTAKTEARTAEVFPDLNAAQNHDGKGQSA